MQRRSDLPKGLAESFADLGIEMLMEMDALARERHSHDRTVLSLPMPGTEPAENLHIKFFGPGDQLDDDAQAIFSPGPNGWSVLRPLSIKRGGVAFHRVALTSPQAVLLGMLTVQPLAFALQSFYGVARGTNDELVGVYAALGDGTPLLSLEFLEVAGLIMMHAGQDRRLGRS